jgi:hypothetical protein
VDILQLSPEQDDLDRRLEEQEEKFAAGRSSSRKRWAIQGTCSDGLGTEDEICGFQGGVSEDAQWKEVVVLQRESEDVIWVPAQSVSARKRVSRTLSPESMPFQRQSDWKK